MITAFTIVLIYSLILMSYLIRGPRKWTFSIVILMVASIAIVNITAVNAEGLNFDLMTITIIALITIGLVEHFLEDQVNTVMIYATVTYAYCLAFLTTLPI